MIRCDNGDCRIEGTLVQVNAELKTLISYMAMEGALILDQEDFTDAVERIKKKEKE